MKTISVLVSDIEFNKFGLKKEQLTFSDLIEIVSNELSRQTLDRSIQLAAKYGLSKMTMSEITREVKAVRKNAKGRH